MKNIALFITALMGISLGCEAQTIYVHDRVVTATDCDTIFADPSTSSSGGESSTTEPPVLECPTITDGIVQFCLDGYPCRNVYFDGVAESNGLGPIVLGLHGTYEPEPTAPNNPGWLGYNPGSDLLSMAIAEHGIMTALAADPDVDNDGEPFPWWPVCGVMGTNCDRDDDFAVLGAVAQCAIEQGRGAANRVVMGGMSAGGILSSLALEQDLGVTLAGVVSWSGGTPLQYQPTVPTHIATSVFVLHGGSTDQYCGVGQPAGTCNGYQPYLFAAPSEQLASDVQDAGGFSFVCNHGGGHNAQMGSQGAEFLAVARSNSAHPWVGFPFGVDGYGSWPNMSGGTNWMLRFYGDCHNPA